MKNKRHIHGGETLAQKELTRSGGDRTTGQRGTTSNRHSIPSDPLQGWFSLASPSLKRQSKWIWKGGRK